MSAAKCTGPASPALRAGIEQFNRGQFYECHDTLEALWMAESGPIRDLYKGILQIGVAFYHLRAGRYRPVVTMLEGGCGYLRPFLPRCAGVDVEHLMVAASGCLDKVKQLGPEGVNDFDWSGIPRIKLEDRDST